MPDGSRALEETNDGLLWDLKNTELGGLTALLTELGGLTPLLLGGLTPLLCINLIHAS